MKKYYLLWIILVCSCKRSYDNEFTPTVMERIENFHPEYRDYCQLDFSINDPELNAVQSAFYGDYQNSLVQATIDASPLNDPSENIELPENKESHAQIRAEVNDILQDENADETNKFMAYQLLQILDGPQSSEETFHNAVKKDAVKMIVEESERFHFTLINEAHYNSQHRKFTTSLLKPLWERGYRYLAMETLSHGDSMLNERGYPIMSSGYYTADSNMGNMIREALKIGYTLVAYETQSSNDGTLRDKDQATYIYKQTYAIDSLGKVLIHAGYSHIGEIGDQYYEPMGYQLKKMIDSDILTIDQVSMGGLLDVAKNHPYYNYVNKILNINNPCVFLDEDNDYILEPVIRGSIDMQIYHPVTTFQHGRPQWMKTSSKHFISLPEEVKNFHGHLLRAIPTTETDDAIPVDQLIIDEEQRLILPEGHFRIEIIDCEGSLIKQYQLQVTS